MGAMQTVFGPIGSGQLGITRQAEVDQVLVQNPMRLLTTPGDGA
jgi:hypothetical protein